MSKLSTSSAAMIAAMGPTLDKFKQWSRSRYKCTKQSIFEKLGKTTRTIDVELDAKIEVRQSSEELDEKFVRYTFSKYEKRSDATKASWL
jgi:hypothetical protein